MKKIISAVLCLILLSGLSVTAFADFGDYGGDYDYGGWDDYDYDYDYDYDDDDYDYDYDYDYGGGGSYTPKSSYYSFDGYPDPDNIYYGYGRRYNYSGKEFDKLKIFSALAETLDESGNGDDDDDGSGTAVLCFFILVGIIIAVIVRKKSKSNTKYGNYGSGYSSGSRTQPASRPAGAVPTSAATLRPMAEYRSVDPAFSESEFTEKVSNLYVRFQNAWTDKNMESLRGCLSDAMYSKSERGLQQYIRNKQTNYIERIAVLGVTYSGWKQENGKDIIVVRLNTRITDYTVDDQTGNVLHGSKTAEKFMEYEWSLMRTSGLTSNVDFSAIKGESCPHCGAPIDINKSAICEYCGSVVKSDTFDWVVSDIKGLSQRTVG